MNKDLVKHFAWLINVDPTAEANFVTIKNVARPKKKVKT